MKTVEHYARHGEEKKIKYWLSNASVGGYKKSREGMGKGRTLLGGNGCLFNAQTTGEMIV